MFTCTPAEALNQPYALVSDIADYRAARSAVAAMNDPDRSRGFETLSKNPGLMRSMAYMARAQQGLPLDGGDVEGDGMATAALNRDGPEEE